MSGYAPGMAAWRNARSLIVLRNEIQAVKPGTTFWTIGDDAHKLSWSDHNPNQCCGVVCAADILGNAGLDLNWLANRIVTVDPPALKYVIWQNRIWFPGIGWQSYRGMYHTHVHVSVGVGPDGRSTGNYDDETTWGILLPTTDGGDMADTIASRVAAGRYLRQGDQGDAVYELQVRIGVTADGIFGPVTKTAVQNWQRAHGLSADGIVGPQTWSKLADLTTYQTGPSNPAPAPTPTPTPTEPDARIGEILTKVSNIESILGRVFK